MADPRNFILTKHAVERLHERCAKFAREVEFKEPALKKKAAYDFIMGAKEEKSFMNNSIFMTNLGERYGFENCYTIFARDNIIFIGVTNPRGKFIVTTMVRNEHYLPHISNKVQKFKKSLNEALPTYFPAGHRRAR